jgi:hypothetical protein
MRVLGTTLSILALGLMAFPPANAQQAVAPLPKLRNSAQANAQIIKLIQAGIPESVVLEKIHAATNRFDTSADALIALKKAGATDAELSAIMSGGTVEHYQAVPSPAVTGPKLDQTLQFIADTINELGTVSYVWTPLDGSAPEEVGHTYGQAHFDSAQCTVGYADATKLGNQMPAIVINIPLRQAKDIVVLPMEQYVNSTTSVSPQGIMVLRVRILHPDPNKQLRYLSELVVSDADLADRLAKAFTHAIELCGGGSKDPF